jgi:hypothetical protein
MCEPDLVDGERRRDQLAAPERDHREEALGALRLVVHHVAMQAHRWPAPDDVQRKIVAEQPVEARDALDRVAEGRGRPQGVVERLRTRRRASTRRRRA